MWRAIRYGLDGELIDLLSGEVYPACESAQRLLRWSAPACAELGLNPTLPGSNGAQRQRAMLNEGADMREVYAEIVRLTAETYAPREPGPTEVR